MRYTSTIAYTAISALVYSTIQLIDISIVNGQNDIVGTTICHCQPAVYELTFNFSLTCADRDITNDTVGVLDAGCLVESRGAVENVINAKPIIISDVQILELDKNDQIVGQAVYTSTTYNDGDIISYTSVVQTRPNDMNEITLPKAFQITMTGLNSDEQSITNLWIVRYDNDCGIFPLLTVGQKNGWTVFTKLGDPPSQFCPLAAPPTTTAPEIMSYAPSETPSQITIPTEKPVSIPPIEKPVGIVCPPTFAPTISTIDIAQTSTKSLPIIEKRKKEPPSTSYNHHKDDKTNNRRLGVNQGKPVPVPIPAECPELDSGAKITIPKGGISSSNGSSGDDHTSTKQQKTKSKIKVKKMKVKDEHRDVTADDDNIE